MRVLVTGAKGQLGYDVMECLSKRGHRGVGVDIEEMDITDKAAVKRVIEAEKPDAVIHCAAWTAVDAAEDPENRKKVEQINVEGTGNIARVCGKNNIKIIYLSTDYVFDGEGNEPWSPDDDPHPLNVYGETKYEGELEIKKYTSKYFIVRIAWVYGRNGKNFVKTMLNLGRTKDKISVVDDQIGMTTYTPDLARLLVDMAETERYGIYHATNEGSYISWYDFACRIFEEAQKYDQTFRRVIVTPVTSDKYPSKAKRPHNSRMDTSKLKEEGFAPLPDWENALSRFIRRMMRSI